MISAFSLSRSSDCPKSFGPTTPDNSQVSPLSPEREREREREREGGGRGDREIEGERKRREYLDSLSLNVLK